jgi:hypothetical protein
LYLICIQVSKVSEDNGFSLFVLGKEVHVKVWIHFFIGDTEGNYKWWGSIQVTKRDDGSYMYLFIGEFSL